MDVSAGVTMMILSFLLQLVAAGLALSLIKVTGKSGGWLLLALAILLMAVRRIISLGFWLSGYALPELDFAAEGVALCISLLMVAGLVRLRPRLLAIRRSEIELRESREEYRRMVETAQEGIWVLDAKGLTRFVNRRLADMLGYSAEGMLGRPMGHFLEEASRLELEGYLQRCAQGESEARDFCFRCAGAHPLWAILNATPIFDADGHYDGALGMVTDITRRRQTEEALRESERFARATVDALPQHIAILDANCTILAVNRAWREFARENGAVSEKTGAGTNYLEACAAARSAGHLEAVAFTEGLRAVINGALSEFSLEYPCHSPAESRWFMGRVARFPGEGPVRLVVVHEDITELKQAEKAIQKLAYYDNLTGLPNRLLLHDLLNQTLAQAGRQGRQVGVLFLDLDRFKIINDTFGHAAGDELLKAVARRLRGCIRKSDTVARLGGDEFVVVLPAPGQAEDMSLLAQKILQELSAPIELAGQEVFVSTAIGIAGYPLDGADADALIRSADMAMYQAKTMGYNSYQFFSAEMNRKAEELLLLEKNLHQALEQEQFVLFYQPIFDLATRRVTAVEALLRWQHPEWGLVPPAQFLAVAEETGLIVPISEWVLQTACAQNRSWLKAGVASLPIAVNLSERQIRHYQLEDTVARILSEQGLHPRWLHLELTETMLMNSGEETIDTLLRLKKLGVGITVDHFGTGFSSLSLLKRIAIDTLKIDLTSLHGAARKADQGAIARAIIAMAHTLHLQVIAEGVETEEQFAFLRENNCDCGQGIFFALPATAEDLVRHLQKEKDSATTCPPSSRDQPAG